MKNQIWLGLVCLLAICRPALAADVQLGCEATVDNGDIKKGRSLGNPDMFISFKDGSIQIVGLAPFGIVQGKITKVDDTDITFDVLFPSGYRGTINRMDGFGGMTKPGADYTFWFKCKPKSKLF